MLSHSKQTYQIFSNCQLSHVATAWGLLLANEDKRRAEVRKVPKPAGSKATSFSLREKPSVSPLCSSFNSKVPSSLWENCCSCFQHLTASVVFEGRLQQWLPAFITTERKVVGSLILQLDWLNMQGKKKKNRPVQTCKISDFETSAVQMPHNVMRRTLDKPNIA